jgi:hypothetical protein
MFGILFGIFLILHSFVHLLYFGQSLGYFELKPGMVWPAGAWAFSTFLGEEATRKLAGIFLVLAAMSLAASGIGILSSQTWWRPLVVGAAIFSSIVFALFWNGRMQNLDGQGLVGILINMAILAAVLLLQWPPTD